MAQKAREDLIQTFTARILASVARRSRAGTLGDHLDTAQRIAAGIRAVLEQARVSA